MKKHYYLIGTLYGIALIPVVFFGLFRGDAPKIALEFLSPPHLWPILIGGFSFLAAGVLADRWKRQTSPGGFATTATLVTVFVMGVVIGSLSNFLISALPPGEYFDFTDDLWSWAGKPAYWLLLFGLPSAVFLGVSYYVAHRILGHREN